MNINIPNKETKENKSLIKSKLSPKKIPEKATVESTNISRRHSALSLKSLSDKRISTKNIKKEVDTSNLPSNSFTTEEIQKQWELTKAKFNKNGDKLLASLMSSCTPIANGNFLNIELPNKLMKADLEKSKLKIIPHIRKELNNYKIDFNITVNEEVVKKFAYTNAEKFAYLNDKNKLISVLKTKFSLDL